MQPLSRRQFIQGLVAAATVATAPALPAIVPPAAPIVPPAGNTLIPPDQVAKEALRILRKYLTFRKDYNIETDGMIYIADYHVPGHFEGPLPIPMPAGAMQIRSNVAPEDLVETRTYVDEVHVQVGVELPEKYRDMIPELEEEMIGRLEDHLNGQPAKETEAQS